MFFIFAHSNKTYRFFGIYACICIYFGIYVGIYACIYICVVAGIYVGVGAGAGIRINT